MVDLKEKIGIPNHCSGLVDKRGLELVEAKIKRLSDYYRRKSKLPSGWKYSRATAESILK